MYEVERRRVIISTTKKLLLYSTTSIFLDYYCYTVCQKHSMSTVAYNINGADVFQECSVHFRAVPRLFVDKSNKIETQQKQHQNNIVYFRMLPCIFDDHESKSMYFSG